MPRPMSDAVGSLWFKKTAAGAEYPGDGQGGVAASAAASTTILANAGQPVIVEAVSVESCSVAGAVTIQNHGGTIDVEVINVPTSTSAQWFPVGGVYGARVHSGIRASNTGTMVGVRIWYRRTQL